MPLASFTSFVGDHGLSAVFLLLLAAAVVPAASELVMLYGGAIASGAIAGTHVVFFGNRLSAGLASYLAIAVAGLAGNLVGAAGGWALGLRGGRPFLERYGRYIHVSEQKIDRTVGRFERFEWLAVLVGFCAPVLRSFVAVPAGLVRVPFPRFLAAAFVGCGIFCFGVAALGWAVGSSWDTVHHDLRYVDAAVVAGLVLAAAYLLLRRKRSTTLSRRA